MDASLEFFDLLVLCRIVPRTRTCRRRGIASAIESLQPHGPDTGALVHQTDLLWGEKGTP